MAPTLLLTSAPSVDGLVIAPVMSTSLASALFRRSSRWVAQSRRAARPMPASRPRPRRRSTVNQKAKESTEEVKGGGEEVVMVVKVETGGGIQRLIVFTTKEGFAFNLFFI